MRSTASRKIGRTRAPIAALAGMVVYELLAGTARGEPIPSGWTAKNFAAVGFSPVPAFKLAIRQVAGRWFLYAAGQPSGIYVIEVTDPRNPQVLRRIASPANTSEIQVTLHGDLMITGMAMAFSDDMMKGIAPDPTVAVQHAASADKDYAEGIRLWGLKDPTNPQELSRWEGGALGTHRNAYPGGKYAYLTATVPGFRSFILIILDVGDPAHPHEVGRWWYPGQKADEPVGEVAPGLHGPAAVGARAAHLRPACL